MNQQLNAMSFPLHGRRLIEASAGTGKTYTIASLYLRLLLGHGDDDNRHPRPLSVEEILVVTFTEAATEELRDRIRKRIHQAREAFLLGQSEDPFIAELLANTANHEEKASWLLAAERQMDEAAVFTIHGFCQRMLKENAFESGALFDNEFIADESELLYQAVADFWRVNFYPLSAQICQELNRYWDSPLTLMMELWPLLNLTGLRPVQTEEEDIQQKDAAIRAAIEACKAKWRAAIADVEALIADSGVDKRSYSSRNLSNWLVKMADWATSADTGYVLPDCLEKFSQAVLHEKTKKGEVPRHPVFDEIDALLARDLSLKPMILALALKEVKHRLQLSKRRKMQLAFDDLLTSLDQALVEDCDAQLASRIRGRFPVAMIDEFQDTDPLQYRIFNTLYPESGEQGLFMIGDPKQAIYGFRGADIFTYIQARRESSARYTLSTNYRSASAVVDTTNLLFEQSEAAFIYASDIPFTPVKAAGKAAALTIDSHTLPALRLCMPESDEVLSRANYQYMMAEACAADIADKLNLAAQGQARLGERALEAGDIAILVRTGKEAALVRQSLARLNVASVYLSNRDSVFNSELAFALYLVLDACLTPEHEEKLRAALACPLFHFTAPELEQLNLDEMAWEQQVANFKYYLKLWRSRGVLPMLREIIKQQGVGGQLLSQAFGERKLTDLLHLGEILQQTAASLESEAALLRWYSHRLQQALGGAEEQIQRLESDQALVKVITIHKSKGLEYPMVYLPFVCLARTADKAIYHEGGQTRVDLAKGKEALEKADIERMAEDLRLLYVAMTRAAHGTWLGMAPVKAGRSAGGKTDLHQSALGYLLFGQEAVTQEALARRLAALCALHPGIVQLPPVEGEAYVGTQVQDTQVSARRFERELERNWRITSYSGLVSHGHHEMPGLDLEVSHQLDTQVLDIDYTSVFAFPRGARAGTFLHTVFESLVFPEARAQVLTDILSELLTQHGFDEAWLPSLQTLVSNVLDCPLPQVKPGFSLRQLEEQDKKVEMEFFLPLSPINATALSEIIAQDTLSAPLAPLSFQRVQGMLKGFIDLIFCVDGVYYVADYKSNHLGDTHQDYHSGALVEAMQSHRYELQYQLYTLALHRLLKQRMPDYDYDTHIGGCFYFFLRGMAEEGDKGVFFVKPPLGLIEDLDRLFEQGAAHAE